MPVDVPTHYEIKIPAFAGYKTLAVNGAFLLFGVVSMLWPAIHKPDPQAMGVLFDQGTGAIVALLTFANMCLRLVTTTPAAPFLPKIVDHDAPAVGTASKKVADAPAQISYELQQLLSRADAPSRYEDDQGAHHYEGCRSYYGLPCDCSWGGRLPQLISLPRPRVWSGYARGAQTVRAGLAATFITFLTLTTLVGGTLTLGACAEVQQVNAVAAAKTIEQKAFAAYGTFVVLEETGAKLIRSTAIPQSARRQIKIVDTLAKPAADSVRILTQQLVAAEATLGTAGLASPGQVAQLTQQLTAAVATLQPRVEAMSAAIQGAH